MPPAVVSPASLDELAMVGPIDPGLRYVGGGTLEIPRWQRAGAPRAVVYLPGIRELQVHGEGRCGAGRTMAQVAEDPLIPPVLREAAGAIATPAVRNLATLGGNIAACNPGCLAVPLLALDATAELWAPGQSADSMPVEKAIADNRMAHGRAVLLSVAWPGPRRVTALQRATLRRGVGPVLANVAVSAVEDRDRPRWIVAVGGTGALPQRLRRAERHLNGDRPLPRQAATVAAAELMIRPSVALAGQDDYQRHLVRVLVRRAVSEVLDGNVT